MTISPEINELLRLVQKSNKVSRPEQVTDYQLLSYILKHSRWLSLEETFIKKLLNKSPKSILKLLQQNKAKTTQTNHQAERYWQDQGQGLAKDTLGLLAELLQSPDPAIQIISNGLSTEEISEKRDSVQKNKPFKLVLFYFKETLDLVVTVLVSVIAIKFFIGEMRVIPSGSMLETLQIEDRVLVERVSYWFSQPQRGDIMVFYPPEPETILRNDPLSWALRVSGLSAFLNKPESLVDRAFIKRTIGLPGETIEVVPNVGVKINGQLLNENYTREIANRSCTLAVANLIEDQVTFPNNKTLLINNKPYSGPELIDLTKHPERIKIENNYLFYCGPIRIPKDSYFMMGDNRNQSQDSRYWGVLKRDRIIGKASFRVWPWDNRVGSIQPTPEYDKP